MGSVVPPKAPPTAAEIRAMQADLRGHIRCLVESYPEPGKGNKVCDKKVLAEMARMERAIVLLGEFKSPFPPKIESGVPLPSRSPRDSDPKPKWTPILRRMKPGDSVCVLPKWASGIITSGHRIGIRTSRQFTGIKVRIWRTN